VEEVEEVEEVERVEEVEVEKGERKEVETVRPGGEAPGCGSAPETAGCTLMRTSPTW
jgi:hypothetical protein